MSNAEILQDIFSEILEVDRAELNDEFSQEAAKSWDSLGMVRLISELEARFAVEFNLSEIVRFKTLGNVRKALIAKGVAF